MIARTACQPACALIFFEVVHACTLLVAYAGQPNVIILTDTFFLLNIKRVVLQVRGCMHACSIPILEGHGLISDDKEKMS